MEAKTQIITAILLLVIIAPVSALYSGECETIKFPNLDAVNWSVEGNSSDMTGFSYNKIDYNITYCFHRLYMPDNFTITFYNYQEVYVDNPSSSSGGSALVIVLNDSKLFEGILKTIKKGTILKFDGHILLFKYIRDGRAYFMLRSTPIYFDLTEGSATLRKFGNFSYNITASNFNKNKVDVYIQKVQNYEKTDIIQDSNITDIVNDIDVINDGINDIEKSKWMNLFVVIVVIVLFMVGYRNFRKKRRKS